MVKKAEPNLRDVIEAMNQRFNMISFQFDKNEKQFAFLSSKLFLLHEDVRDLQHQQEFGLDEMAELIQEHKS